MLNLEVSEFGHNSNFSSPHENSFVGNNKTGWGTKRLPYRLQALIVEGQEPAAAGIGGKSGSDNDLNISNRS